MDDFTRTYRPTPTSSAGARRLAKHKAIYRGIARARVKAETRDRRCDND